MKPIELTGLVITLPAWVNTEVDWASTFSSDDEKMALVLQLAANNVLYESGGPFAAAIFNGLTGNIVGVGVNSVVNSNNSVLHAEIMAIMFAEHYLCSFSLSDSEAGYELFSSCEPCAMCLGATLWSGVGRLVCAAAGEDARAVGFDEGPVFSESYNYLEQAGITVTRGVQRAAAVQILQAYVRDGGCIYNGRK